jgi:hypothetical protein
LEIKSDGTAANEARLTINEKYNASDTGFGVDFKRTYDTGGDAQDAGYIRMLRAGGNTNGGLTFGVGDRGAVSERLRIDSSGRLGIGTSSPSAQLHLSQSGTSSYTTLKFSNTGASGRTYEIGVGGSTSASGYAGNLYVYDSTATATRVVLDSSGRLGIGTTSVLA